MGPTVVLVQATSAFKFVQTRVTSKLPTFQAVDILANFPLGKMYSCHKIANLILSKLNFYK